MIFRWQLLVVVAAAACRPPEPTRSLEVSLTAESFTGTNGVRVYTMPDSSAEFIGFHVRYAAGSTADPAGKEGLAHLVEHLMFSRTIAIGATAITLGSRIDEIGLDHNAFTRWDHTHYWTLVPPRHLEEMFAIATVRMTGGCDAIDQATFEREREVVRNEIRQRTFGDAGKYRPLLLETVYGQHPYARPIGGSDASLRAITRADVCAFIAEHYAPSKAVFYVVGNTTPSQVRQAASKWLGRIPPREVAVPPVIAPAPPNPIKRKVTLDVEAHRLLAAWPVPVDDSAYAMRQRVVSALESRIGFFVFTYEIGSEVDVWIDGGNSAPVIVAHIKLRSAGKYDEAVDAIRKAAGSVEFDLPKEELSRSKIDMFDARSYSTESLLASFESIRSRGSAFANLADRSGGKRFLVEEVEAIAKLKVGTLRSYASKMLDPDKATLLLIEPSGKLSGATTASGAAINHESNAWKLEIDPKLAYQPLLLPAALRGTPILDDYRLGNGMRVILAVSGDLPLVRTRLLFSVGSAHEPANRPALALFVSGVLGGSVDGDFTRFGSRELNTRIDLMIRRLARGKRHISGFAIQNSIEKLRKSVARTQRQPSVAIRSRFERAVQRGLYGAEHPYASRGFIDPDALGSINQSDLDDFATDYFGARNATLIVAGRYDISLIKRYIEAEFAHWEERRHAPEISAATRPRGSRIVAASDPTASQLEVRVMFPTPAGVDESHPARQVLAAMIAGRMRRLREERGITYGASVGAYANVGPGLFQVSLEVDPSRAAEAVVAVLDELAALRSQSQDDRAVDFVAGRRQVARRILLRRSDPTVLIDQLERAVRFGLPLDYRLTAASRVAAVTPADVDALVAGELAADRQLLGLYGAKAAVEAARVAARSHAAKPKPAQPTD